MKKIALRAARSLALGGIVMAASPAFAQEEIEFQGFRVGGLAGFDVVSAGVGDEVTGGGEIEDTDLEGAAFYIELGRDFQIGNLVLGFGSEYGTSTASVEITDGTALEEVETGVDFFIGARVGAVVGDRTMIYAKGGYTNNEVKYTVDDPELGTFELDPGVDGFRIGVGVEHMISSSFYIKGEARYSNYSNLELTRPDDTELDIGIDLDRTQVLVGAGFRF
ncbi:MAG: porin family protein [Pseudomonadota bacterium]